MSRGPYKQYEYDPTVSVQKTTSYNKRKRSCKEDKATENGSTCDNIGRTNMVGTIIFLIQ
jgi:hypothetical protein